MLSLVERHGERLPGALPCICEPGDIVMQSRNSLHVRCNHRGFRNTRSALIDSALLDEPGHRWWLRSWLCAGVVCQPLGAAADHAQLRLLQALAGAARQAGLRRGPRRGALRSHPARGGISAAEPRRSFRRGTVCVQAAAGERGGVGGVGRAGDGRGAACPRSGNLDVLQAGLHCCIRLCTLIVDHARLTGVMQATPVLARTKGAKQAAESAPQSRFCAG